MDVIPTGKVFSSMLIGGLFGFLLQIAHVPEVDAKVKMRLVFSFSILFDIT